MPRLLMLLLASESPRRRELLHQAGFEFTVEPAVGVEELKKHSDPRALPAINAGRKAAAVAALHPEDWVLGADTIVLFGNRVIGKPRDLNEAEEILLSLSGEVHEVITGVALIGVARGIREIWSEVTRVRFRELTSETIRRYLELVPVLDKAGAYGIQEHGEMLVESVDGDFNNVIGLPISSVTEHLKKYF